jgi:SAM-dependent methyltransferase
VKTSLLSLLRCPSCGTALSLEPAAAAPAVTSGMLVCAGGAHRHPIVDGIPRFVPQDNYAASFGLQWNHFRQTQLDSHSGVPITRDRFFASTRWAPERLRGRRVLDLGCGSGRFAEIALSTGAHVVAVDYSRAADACQLNLGSHPNLDVVQASVYDLPFAPGTFDFVYCLGVLQHTPDPEGAFRALARQLAPGGHIAVDLYPKFWRNLIWPKYWIRPITARIAPARLFGLVQRLVPVLLPVSRVLGRAPAIGRWLRHAVPVSNYEGVYPLDERQLREWAVLDTFDMWSPIHDHPQSAVTVDRWLAEAGLDEREVFRVGHLVGRGARRGADVPGSQAG